MATKTIRTVRRVEKPRPLKTSENLIKLQPIANELSQQNSDKSLLNGDKILENLKCLHVSISNGNLNESTFALISHVCCQLKDAGSYLESNAKDQLDKYFVTLRNASRDERIAMHFRIRLLEIIELRAMGWKTNININSYYEQRIVNSEQLSPTFLVGNSVGVPNTLMSSVSTSAIPTSIFQPPCLMTSASQVSLGPGEIIKNSGKFIKPTKIPGKNFFKDEILIRNSDSGKVMGIKGRRVHMIEELSDTIISFQRVSPGARDRLVQITGPHEENISRAKVLIEDTIRRNASPVRDTPELGLGGLVPSGSCTSLNSSASEESLHNQPVTVQYQPPKSYVQPVSNVLHHAHVTMQPCQPSQAMTQQQPQIPNKKIPLTHSFSMGNNTLGEYSYTIAVGPNAIRISGSEAEVVKTAKLVLEEYFAGQAELSHNQPSSALLSSHRKHSQIQKQITLDSENGGSLSNGHMGNSSSEEDTFKAEGSPTDRVFNTFRPGLGGSKIMDLPLDSPQIQPTTFVQTFPLYTSDLSATAKVESTSQVENSINLNRNPVAVVRQPLFPASKLEDYKKAENVGDMAKRRRDMFGRSSSQKNSSSLEKSFERQTSEDSKRTDSSRVLNPYNFLLDCALSDACKLLPRGLKSVTPDVACIIVQENPTEYFDPVAYKAMASVRRNSLATRKSSTSGPDEVWELE